MLDLTFFTSNATKLAHARYIVSNHPIKIKGFRQRTYHADYTEPRLLSRDELLEASYRSALEQCAKAGIAVDSHPFILEDTSVKIDALSNDGEEVPGLEIKYWMQDQNFETLDASLKARGNIRSASVRSDVLLHVPKNLKGQWGVQADYLVFVGSQSGKIIDAPADFSPNLVYPWLDNQTFNKWFQPTGCDRPFGSLAIEEANLVDFRRKSFSKLLHFLEEKHQLSVASRQLEFVLDRTPSLILSGYTCAGKTAASQYLARKFGYLHVEASDFMYLSYYYRHGYKGEISIGDFAEHALAQKPDIAAEKVAEYIAENIASPVVVSGFRAPEEIEFLKAALAPHGKIFNANFVTADSSTRFKRLQSRMRPGDDITFDDLLRRDEQQARMGLERIREMPIVVNISNCRSLDEYFHKIDKLVGASGDDEIEILAALSSLRSVREIKLEDAILIALLSAWESDETRPFFSTTQIARMIREFFDEIVPKYKDNVSRYFNQDFYAYYEISSEGRARTRKYRLSNTGYGMAVRALRRLTSKKE